LASWVHSDLPAQQAGWLAHWAGTYRMCQLTEQVNLGARWAGTVCTSSAIKSACLPRWHRTTVPAQRAGRPACWTGKVCTHSWRVGQTFEGLTTTFLS
jgi:hypothetical protein